MMLKVIGVGFGCIGIFLFKFVFEKLGFEKCYYM